MSDTGSTGEMSQAKKPRASRPKVKTGCVTCKARRVKCDEAKPHCLRCSNFGRICGGYPSNEDNPRPKAPSLQVPRRLLSKAMQGSPSPSRTPSPAPRPAPTVRQLGLPVGVVFQDEREHQYFLHFRDETAIEISTGFDPSLWNVLVLKACDIPAIRQLVVATAALSLAMTKSELGARDIDTSAHHQYALQKYGEALKGIREMVANGQDSIRIALISALLIFCFETLHGDLDRAIDHVRSAVEMIVKEISSTPQSFYFTRTNTLGARGSSAIDDELLTAFMRLDRPSLTCLSKNETRMPEPNRIFSSLFSQEHLEIPGGFETTTEARAYLEDIKWRIMPSGQPPESIKDLWNMESNDSPNLDLVTLPAQLRAWYKSFGVENSKNTSLELAHWHDAFSSILNYSMTPAGDSLFVAAVMLHIQALSTDLLANGFASSNSAPVGSSAGDLHSFPTVHAILSLSRRLVAHPKFLRAFVFDVGIVPSLVNICMLCPDQELKLEAIDVLKSMVPRREGWWDSRVAVEAGERWLQQGDEQVDFEMVG
ncbi:uncharacterized protein BP5553_02354 [Venustampulla echinocandica]|uniref:Zn(2)-C6 fungal-type domain-containing protein n=1 Tax=Venustampulla echinocandica TaxID=2656787 RepID=A0A370U3M7_9HELO|nr:uncharacterized protein BP5553_02354 [Venustampulla echinocandica]RDL42375.1 hypothetical protein BP5553_02354 [Venustampulla echinocandica]